MIKLGDTPFVGASDSNNGVTAFVGNNNESADEKTALSANIFITLTDAFQRETLPLVARATSIFICSLRI